MASQPGFIVFDTTDPTELVPVTGVTTDVNLGTHYLISPGIVLKSPSGSYFLLSVDDNGVLSTQPATVT